MKAYIQYRADLADAAAVGTAVTANPGAYTIGTIIVAADGSASIVTAAGTVGTIGVT